MVLNSYENLTNNIDNLASSSSSTSKREKRQPTPLAVSAPPMPKGVIRPFNNAKKHSSIRPITNRSNIVVMGNESMLSDISEDSGDYTNVSRKSDNEEGDVFVLKRKRDPNGMPKRTQLMDNVIDAIRERGSSFRKSIEKYRTPVQKTHDNWHGDDRNYLEEYYRSDDFRSNDIYAENFSDSDDATNMRRRRRDMHYIKHDARNGMMNAVNGIGELTGERFMPQIQCNMITKECNTVLAPARRRNVYNSLTYWLGIQWFFSIICALPNIVLGSLYFSVKFIRYSVKFCIYMFILYLVMNLVLAVLRVAFVLNIGDLTGRYQYIIRLAAYSARCLAWTPIFLTSYAVWLIGTMLDIEMGPPPVLLE